MKKFMKKSEREKYTFILVAYYSAALMLIFSMRSNIINLDILGIVANYLNFVPLLVSFILLLPFHIALYLLSMWFMLWVLNKTRYFAWPTDKFIHSAVTVSIMISVFEVLILGTGFDINPLSHIYLYMTGIDDWQVFIAKIFVFLTFVFVPYFVYSSKTLDYNYFASTMVSLEAAFLSSMLGIFYIGITGVYTTDIDINGDFGQYTVLLYHVALYLAVLIIINLIGRYYNREHQTAIKAGTVYIEPEWRKVHIFGYYWRPGHASEKGTKKIMAILLIIFIAIVVMFIVTGYLHL